MEYRILYTYIYTYIIYNIYIKIDAMFYVFRKFFLFFLLLTICHPTIGHGRHYATYRYRYTIKCHLQCVYPAVSTIYIYIYTRLPIYDYNRLFSSPFHAS